MAESESRYYDENAQSFLLYSVSFDLEHHLETRDKGEGTYSLLPSLIFRTALPKPLLTAQGNLSAGRDLSQAKKTQAKQM